MLKLIEEEKEETVKNWLRRLFQLKDKQRLFYFFAEVPDKLVCSRLGRLIVLNQYRCQPK